MTDKQETQTKRNRLIVFTCLDCNLKQVRKDYYKVREGRKVKRVFCYCSKCGNKLEQGGKKE